MEIFHFKFLFAGKSVIAWNRDHFFVSAKLEKAAKAHPGSGITDTDQKIKLFAQKGDLF